MDIYEAEKKASLLNIETTRTPQQNISSGIKTAAQVLLNTGSLNWTLNRKVSQNRCIFQVPMVTGVTPSIDRPLQSLSSASTQRHMSMGVGEKQKVQSLTSS